MKKIIGILGIAVIAAGMFFSANALNGSAKDITLSDFTTLNTANADWPEVDGTSADEECSVTVWFDGPFGVGGMTKDISGCEINCYTGPGCCTHTNCK